MKVGFLAHARDRLSLKGKLNKFKKTPTPSTLSELVQCYLRLGEPENALKYTAWGVKQFSNYPVVKELHRISVRARARIGVEETKEEVSANPNPDSFLRLAKYALQVPDGFTAMAALQECVLRFPTCGPAHSLLAELYERRFVRDLSAADGREVVHLLAKARRLDPTDVSTEIRLSRFYARVGAVNEARKHLTALLARDNSHEDARVLLKNLDRLSDEMRPAEDINDLLVRIEDVGRLPFDGQETRRMQDEVRCLARALPDVTNKLGARRSVVVDTEGDAFDENGPAGDDSFVSVTANLSRSAHMMCRRTGLGPLRGATMESAGGTLVLRRGFRASVGCLLPKDQSILGSQEMLAQVISQSRAGGGGSS